MRSSTTRGLSSPDRRPFASNLVILAFGTCALLAPAWSSAQEQEPAYTQPVQDVFRSALVYPQEQGEVQLTVVARSGEAGEWDPFGTAFEYGLTDAWAAEIEWHSSLPWNTGGMSGNPSGVELSTQYSFMNVARSPFHVAFGVSTEFEREPAGSMGWSRQGEPYAAVGWDLPGSMGLHLFTHAGTAFGGRHDNDEDADEPETSAGRAYVWNSGVLAPIGAVCLVAEFSLAGGEGDVQQHLIPGAVVSLAEGWEVALGVPIGLTAGSERARVVVHVVREFAF